MLAVSTSVAYVGAPVNAQARHEDKYMDKSSVG